MAPCRKRAINSRSRTLFVLACYSTRRTSRRFGGLDGWRPIMCEREPFRRHSSAVLQSFTCSAEEKQEGVVPANRSMQLCLVCGLRHSAQAARHTVNGSVSVVHRCCACHPLAFWLATKLNGLPELEGATQQPVLTVCNKHEVVVVRARAGGKDGCLPRGNLCKLIYDCSRPRCPPTVYTQTTHRFATCLPHFNRC